MRIERHAMLGSIFRDSAEKVIRERTGNETQYAVHNKKESNKRHSQEHQQQAQREGELDDPELDDSDSPARFSGLNIVA